MNKIKIAATILIAAGLFLLAGCGKTASSGGGGGSQNYQKSTQTVNDAAGLKDALAKGIDTITIPENIEIEVTGNLTITEGKELIVADGATLNVSNNAAITLNGIIIVEPGAVLYDYGAYKRVDDAPSGPWQKNDDASIVFETGAKGYRHYPSPGPGEIYFVGDDDNATIKLEEGNLILKRYAYELHGEAKINGQSFVLTGAEKAVVESGGKLTLASDAIIKLDGEMVVTNGGKFYDTAVAGGTIWSGGGSGSLTFEYGSAGYLGSAKLIGNDDDGIIELGNSATFTLYKNSYEITGQVTIHDNFVAPTPVNGMNGAKIIVASNKTVVLEGNSLTLSGGKTYAWTGSSWEEEV